MNRINSFLFLAFSRMVAGPYHRHVLVAACPGHHSDQSKIDSHHGWLLVATVASKLILPTTAPSGGDKSLEETSYRTIME
jgi:hypothetical protein